MGVKKNKLILMHQTHSNKVVEIKEIISDLKLKQMQW